jgi:hypothetical protein
MTDEPTVMICEQALAEIETMRRERTEWGSEIPPSRAVESEALKAVRQDFAAAKEMVAPSEASEMVKA